jgi:Predicted Zn-dependent protease (DUF2268)
MSPQLPTCERSPASCRAHFPMNIHHEWWEGAVPCAAPVAVRELNHNLRYSTVPWDPATVTVGEQIVSEGLADAFARQLYGDLGYGRIGLPSLHDDAVSAKVVANLDVAGMQNFIAWLHGVATAGAVRRRARPAARCRWFGGGLLPSHCLHRRIQ